MIGNLRARKFQFSTAVYNKVGKYHKYVVRNNRIYNDIQEKLNKINGSKVDAVKQKFRSCSCKHVGFKTKYEISCTLQQENLFDFEDVTHFSDSDVVCTSAVLSCMGCIM